MPHRSHMSITTQAATEAAKAAPPVAAAVGAATHSISINHVVGAVTIAYVVLQAAYLIWRWRRDHRRDVREQREQKTGCDQ